MVYDGHLDNTPFCSDNERSRYDANNAYKKRRTTYEHLQVGSSPGIASLSCFFGFGAHHFSLGLKADVHVTFRLRETPVGQSTREIRQTPWSEKYLVVLFRAQGDEIQNAPFIREF